MSNNVYWFWKCVWFFFTFSTVIQIDCHQLIAFENMSPLKCDLSFSHSMLFLWHFRTDSINGIFFWHFLSYEILNTSSIPFEIGVLGIMHFKWPNIRETIIFCYWWLHYYSSYRRIKFQHHLTDPSMLITI